MHMMMQRRQRRWYFDNSWRQLQTIGSGGTDGGGRRHWLRAICGCGSGGWRRQLAAAGEGGRRWQRRGDYLRVVFRSPMPNLGDRGKFFLLVGEI